MKRITFISTIVIILFGCNNKVSESVDFNRSAKVIGYLPFHRFDQSANIEYCKLTHLNLSFANPNTSGDLIAEPIGNIVNDACSANPKIKVFISLAGGTSDSQIIKNWSNLIDKEANRPAFIAKIVDYVLINNLDGVDVDLEWDLVTEGYSEFVIALNTALDSHEKMLTAALPNNTRFTNITNEALNVFDFINIMAYDATGPWAINNPGQHSSLQYSKDGVNFWKSYVNISANRLTLGVPFYGYNFGVNPVSSVTFQQVVAQNSTLSDLDQFEEIYYNGRKTIEAKVELAKNEVGGIMIWELGQDSFNEYSLLSTIHNKYTDLKVKTTGLCGNE